MTELRAYPPSAPRIVATRAGRKGAGRYVAAASTRARARWAVAASSRLGDRLWRIPSPDVQLAWDVGARFLCSDEQIVVGVLSDPGPLQRLTMIPADEDIVVKVAVSSGGGQAIERERENLMELHGTRWQQLGPRVRDDPRITNASRATLLMEKVCGHHPRWDDPAVHRGLQSALSQVEGVGLCHGDVTPWNVVQREDDGSLILLDWEFADLSGSAHPICGLLDFVLRGAVVARARQSHVRSILLSLVQCSDGSRSEIVELYRGYRSRIATLAAGRPDALSHQADHLLDAGLRTETRR